MSNPNELPVAARDANAQAFKRVLSDAGVEGKTVLVVGPTGTGKSALLRRFVDLSEGHSELDCTTKLYRFSATDDADAFLEVLLHQTFGMTRAQDGRPALRGPGWREQVEALFGVVGADKLVASLVRPDWTPNWQGLLDLFGRLSDRMAAKRRVVFLIDPEPYLRSDACGAWLPVVRGLPPKFVLVFGQRPDGVLASHPEFGHHSVVWIPTHPGSGPPPGHPLARFAPGPLVDARLIPRVIVQSYAKLIKPTHAATVIAESAAFRQQCDATATVIQSCELPPPNVPPYEYWLAAFSEARLHGPRMVAALLLVVPYDQFTPDARAARAELLEALEAIDNR